MGGGGGGAQTRGSGGMLPYIFCISKASDTDFKLIIIACPRKI